MHELVVVLGVLLLHFIFDFCLQKHEWAQNKSSDNQALAEHVFIYSVLWAPVFGLKFAAITAIAHFLTDWNTSRINKYVWQAVERKEPDAVHMFFVSVGFDQFLHCAQLFATLLWLNGTAAVL
jgi:hypothetical protein